VFTFSTLLLILFPHSLLKMFNPNLSIYWTFSYILFYIRVICSALMSKVHLFDRICYFLFIKDHSGHCSI
jgi:hypothetical protein